jgi:hypothetical protein
MFSRRSLLKAGALLGLPLGYNDRAPAVADGPGHAPADARDAGTLRIYDASGTVLVACPMTVRRVSPVRMEFAGKVRVAADGMPRRYRWAGPDGKVFLRGNLPDPQISLDVSHCYEGGTFHFAGAVKQPLTKALLVWLKFA